MTDAYLLILKHDYCWKNQRFATEAPRHGEDGKDISIKDLNSITERIIGCAIEVYKHLGPGLMESIYEMALCHQLELQGLHYLKQVGIPVAYKGIKLGEYRLDLLVEKEIIVELKAVDKITPVFEAQLLTYLKVTGIKIGLLLNFNVPILKNGIKRMIL